MSHRIFFALALASFVAAFVRRHPEYNDEH